MKFYPSENIHITWSTACSSIEKAFNQIDSDSKRIRQKFYKFFINEKFKKIFHFFTCILPNHVPHEITKEF